MAGKAGKAAAAAAAAAEARSYQVVATIGRNERCATSESGKVRPTPQAGCRLGRRQPRGLPDARWRPQPICMKRWIQRKPEGKSTMAE